MKNKIKIIYIFLISLFYLMSNSTISWGFNDLEKESQDYQQEMKRIQSLITPIKQSSKNDINSYEEFADGIQKKWKEKNPEYYARLILEICSPLTSGNFEGEKPYLLAKKYALDILSDANRIFIGTEIDLVKKVSSVDPRDPWVKITEKEWIDNRRQIAEVSLHAWKRLIDSIDPAFDANDQIPQPEPPEGLPYGVGPEAVKDPVKRKEFAKSLGQYYKKSEWRVQQIFVRKWLTENQKKYENAIVWAYSLPPYNNDQLQQYLDRYLKDEATKDRIVTAVKTNIERAAKDKPK